VPVLAADEEEEGPAVPTSRGCHCCSDAAESAVTRQCAQIVDSPSAVPLPSAAAVRDEDDAHSEPLRFVAAAVANSADSVAAPMAPVLGSASHSPTNPVELVLVPLAAVHSDCVLAVLALHRPHSGPYSAASSLAPRPLVSSL